MWTGARLQFQYFASAVPMRNEGGGLLAASGLVATPGDAQRQGQRRLGFQRQVGQHVAHQRLLDQLLLEGGAVAGVVQRLDQRLAHQGRGVGGAVEPVARSPCP